MWPSALITLLKMGFWSELLESKFKTRVLGSEVLENTGFNIFQGLGIAGYAACLALYVLLYMGINDEDKLHGYGNLKALALFLPILHGIELIAVLIDAKYKMGSNVWLQAFIIGNGSFITFSHAAVLGVVLSMNLSNNLFQLSLFSLLTACLSNALMLAILFAMFHTGVKGFEARQSHIAAGTSQSTSVRTLAF